GKAAESELIQRVGSHDAQQMMPPPKSKKQPLDQAQIKLLARWIDEGAKYEEHWGYRPLLRPALPGVKNKEWVRNPIDAFIAAGHAKKGFAPAAEADRITLLRRLKFDLLGLPATPDEVKAFVAEKEPDAYEKLVERLLASKHYGERMALLWLDLVRYADSGG